MNQPGSLKLGRLRTSNQNFFFLYALYTIQFFMHVFIGAAIFFDWVPLNIYNVLVENL